MANLKNQFFNIAFDSFFLVLGFLGLGTPPLSSSSFAFFA